VWPRDGRAGTRDSHVLLYSPLTKGRERSVDIFLESALGRPKQLHSSIQIRYSEKNAQDATSRERSGIVGGMDQEVETKRTTSHVIIQEPYGHLLPLVRDLFSGEEDVEVIVDRRGHERRKMESPYDGENRRSFRDRRQPPIPMLDVMINLSE